MSIVSHLLCLVTWTCALHPQPDHPELTYVNLPTLTAYPLTYLVLISIIMSMAFVEILLGSSWLTREDFRPHRWWRKQWVDPRPPDLDPPDDPADFMPKLSRGKHGLSRRLLALALLVAIAASDTVPYIDLKSERYLKNYLRSHWNAGGFLVIDRLNPGDLYYICAVVEAGECHLIKKDDNFKLIFDYGCSKTVSPCKIDFIAGSLMDLVTPLSMEGIAGKLIVKQKGTIQYEVINNAGELSVLDTKGYYLPGLQLRLFRPQAYLNEHQGGQYTLDWDKSYLQLKIGEKITISYHSRTYLLILQGFTNAMKTAKSLALKGLTDSGNDNLTLLQNILLLWHTKWIHLGFQCTQCLGRWGFVVPLVVKMGFTKVIPPRCGSCQLGKQ